VHSVGYRLSLRPDRRLDVTTADGWPIPHRQPLPEQPADDLDSDDRVDPETLPPHATQPRIDLGYAVSVLMQQAA
jgi:hypothetical protein